MSISTQTIRIPVENETRICLNCKHFCRHYLFGGEPLHFGHCMYPRLKYRKIDDSCEYFSRRY